MPCDQFAAQFSQAVSHEELICYRLMSKNDFALSASTFRKEKKR
jgi:hypothetical protein